MAKTIQRDSFSTKMKKKEMHRHDKPYINPSDIPS